MDYKEISSFAFKEDPQLYQYYKDDEGNKVLDTISTPYRVVFNKKYKANYEDIIALTSTAYVDFFGSRNPAVRSNFVVSNEIARLKSWQHFEAVALLMQNNFHTTNLIFESYKMKLREDDKFNKMVSDAVEVFGGWQMSDMHSWYGWVIRCDVYITYRFMQALSLGFLSAYDKDKYGI